MKNLFTQWNKTQSKSSIGKQIKNNDKSERKNNTNG